MPASSLFRVTGASTVHAEPDGTMLVRPQRSHQS